MKEYTSANLRSKEGQNLSGNLLSSLGNDNIRGNHIYYFENRIFECKENEGKDLSLSHNYYAWLCLISEHIFWLMKAFCFKQSDLNEENLALGYDKLIKTFCEICLKIGYTEQEIKDIYTKIVKVLVIRHAVIHLGFPNLFPIELKEDKIRNKPSITKNRRKEKFSKVNMEKTIAWYSNPQNFIEAKTEFYFLMSVMDKSPCKPVIFYT